MRELTCSELQFVSGGELTEAEADVGLMTLSLMALCPTPLVLAVGSAALIYYAWC
ncbi:MAG TPA: hypothetical protein VF329_06180 [Gammaproteobacteria bacterium]